MITYTNVKLNQHKKLHYLIISLRTILDILLKHSSRKCIPTKHKYDLD